MDTRAFAETAIKEQDQPSDIWKPHDFRTRFYFLNYVRIALEQCGFRYVRKYFLQVLEDETRWMNETHNLERRNWRQIDGVELKDYFMLFKMFSAWVAERANWSHGRVKYILECVYDFRQSAIHGEEITKDDLTAAMALPEVLGEASTTLHLQTLERRISCEDSAVAEREAKQAFWELAFPPGMNTISVHQLMEMMRLTTSKLVFDYLSREDPKVLRWHYWTCFEQVEWSELTNIMWSSALNKLHLEPMRKFRNWTVHKNVMFKREIQDFVLAAIEFALECQYPEQAVEIEVYAEQHFTGKSRLEVLERLSKACIKDDPSLYGEGRIADRRTAIAALRANSGMFFLTEKAQGKQANVYSTHELYKTVTSACDSEANGMINGHAPADNAYSETRSQPDRSELKTERADCSKWPASMHSQLTDLEVWENTLPPSSKQSDALEAEMQANHADARPRSEPPPPEDLFQGSEEQSEDCDEASPDCDCCEDDNLPEEEEEEGSSDDHGQSEEQDLDVNVSRDPDEWDDLGFGVLTIEVVGGWDAEEECCINWVEW